MLPRAVSLHTAFTGVLAAVLAGIPVTGRALTFSFQKSFDVAGFGSSGDGTPRGIAVSGGSLLVNDALDDQIFVVDPVAETATSTSETDPFACELLNPNCIPTQEWSRVAWDVAAAGGGIWLVDKETINGSTTWLIQLNAAGEYIARFDADVSGADPGGLTYDPRGAGALLVTDRGANWAASFDLSGNLLGVSSLLPGGVGSETPTGIAYFDGDRFLVSDAGDDTVYEFLLPSGGGPATLIGESIFAGIDFASQITDVQSLDYDAASETLYVLDGTTDRVFVFTLVPEPGTALLVALGLAGIAAKRRRVQRS